MVDFFDDSSPLDGKYADVRTNWIEWERQRNLEDITPKSPSKSEYLGICLRVENKNNVENGPDAATPFGQNDIVKHTTTGQDSKTNVIIRARIPSRDLGIPWNDDQSFPNQAGQGGSGWIEAHHLYEADDPAVPVPVPRQIVRLRPPPAPGKPGTYLGLYSDDLLKFKDKEPSPREKLKNPCIPKFPGAPPEGELLAYLNDPLRNNSTWAGRENIDVSNDRGLLPEGKGVFTGLPNLQQHPVKDAQDVNLSWVAFDGVIQGSNDRRYATSPSIGDFVEEYHKNGIRTYIVGVPKMGEEGKFIDHITRLAVKSKVIGVIIDFTYYAPSNTSSMKIRSAAMQLYRSLAVVIKNKGFSLGLTVEDFQKHGEIPWREIAQQTDEFRPDFVIPQILARSKEQRQEHMAAFEHTYQIFKQLGYNYIIPGLGFQSNRNNNFPDWTRYGNPPLKHPSAMRQDITWAFTSPGASNNLANAVVWLDPTKNKNKNWPESRWDVIEELGDIAARAKTLNKIGPYDGPKISDEDWADISTMPVHIYLADIVANYKAFKNSSDKIIKYCETVFNEDENPEKILTQEEIDQEIEEPATESIVSGGKGYDSGTSSAIAKEQAAAQAQADKEARTARETQKKYILDTLNNLQKELTANENTLKRLQGSKNISWNKAKNLGFECEVMKFGRYSSNHPTHANRPWVIYPPSHPQYNNGEPWKCHDSITNQACNDVQYSQWLSDRHKENETIKASCQNLFVSWIADKIKIFKKDIGDLKNNITRLRKQLTAIDNQPKEKSQTDCADGNCPEIEIPPNKTKIKEGKAPEQIFGRPRQEPWPSSVEQIDDMLGENWHKEDGPLGDLIKNWQNRTRGSGYKSKNPKVKKNTILAWAAAEIIEKYFKLLIPDAKLAIGSNWRPDSSSKNHKNANAIDFEVRYENGSKTVPALYTWVVTRYLMRKDVSRLPAGKSGMYLNFNPPDADNNGTPGIISLAFVHQGKQVNNGKPWWKAPGGNTGCHYDYTGNAGFSSGRKGGAWVYINKDGIGASEETKWKEGKKWLRQQPALSETADDIVLFIDGWIRFGKFHGPDKAKFGDGKQIKIPDGGKFSTFPNLIDDLESSQEVPNWNQVLGLESWNNQNVV